VLKARGGVAGQDAGVLVVCYLKSPGMQQVLLPNPISSADAQHSGGFPLAYGAH